MHPNIRNPILISYIAKGLLPYHGLGSGIKRALEEWPAIDLIDNNEGCLFTATVHRKLGSEDKIVKSSPKTDTQILELLRLNSTITAEQLAGTLKITKRAVLKQIDKLKQLGRLQRIGPANGGIWKVIE